MDKPTNDITLFAKTNFRGKEVPFGIKMDDRRRHMYVIGKTGMGKTTLMENMIIQDIINGHGVAFVDPHGDSVEKILSYIPNNRVNDVIYFNPSDLDYPIAFNILESIDSRYKHLVASGLMGVFTKIWANTWSSRMEYILNNTILALLDSPGNTLLGISRIFLDKKYRKKIVDNVKDPMVKAFWTDEFANWQEKYRMEAVAPIQNKVGQFLSSGIIRNIVGQPNSTIDLRQVMDDKKILLLNLSKGRVGEDNSALLGAMIITKLQLAALSRVDIPEEKRSDFYLYVDEFQNFATESFATILSEARKYRLCLTVGHQYIGQLVQEKDTKVRDAVFGNVGTMVTFRVGAADAEFLEKEFAPNFTENDLVNLPKYNIILKLMINGVASDPFTASTLSPTFYENTGNNEKVIRVSRERYANPVALVEAKIMRWMGEQDVHEQVAVLAQSVRSDTQVAAEDYDEPVTIAGNAGKSENTVQPVEEKALEQAAEMIEENSEEAVQEVRNEPIYQEAVEAYGSPETTSVAEAIEDAADNSVELQEKLQSPSPFDAVMASQYANPIPVEPLFESAEPTTDIVKPETPAPKQTPNRNQTDNRHQQNRVQSNDRNFEHRSNPKPNRQKPKNQSPANPIWNSVIKKDSLAGKLDDIFGKGGAHSDAPKNGSTIQQGNRNQQRSHPQNFKQGPARQNDQKNNQKIVLKPGEMHKIEPKE
jgi:hypothetical protein